MERKIEKLSYINNLVSNNNLQGLKKEEDCLTFEINYYKDLVTQTMSDQEYRKVFAQIEYSEDLLKYIVEKRVRVA
jgi:hypothetical protein